ncbi:MAG: phage tail tube protein [Alphaproteobacteria bacterium]
MPYLWRKNVVLIKPETTYGTDPTPTGAANAILAFNGSFDPNPQTALDRRPLRGFLGNAVRPIAGRHVGFQFEVELAGAGAAGSAPMYGPVLRAGGLAETLTADTDAQYDPVSAAWESVTVYWNMDGVLHKMLGARGNPEFVWRAGQVPMLRTSLLGIHADPSATALPTADFSDFQKPLPSTPAHSHTFSLDGYAAKLRELTLTLGQSVVFRQFHNGESVDIVDRAPAGQVTIEAPPLGTKNFFSVAKAETEVALQLVHGTSGGNIVQLDAGQVQLSNPRYSEVEGVQHLVMDLNPVPTGDGDDEIKLTVK